MTRWLATLADLTPFTLLTILGVLFVELGAVLVFRTITGIGPRPGKLVSFGVAGAFAAIAMFSAHVNAGVLWVLGSLAIAFVAQAWHVWLMCRRHWSEWQRRHRSGTHR